ncbi:MAG: hypothetical protein HWN65_24070 [Candidatus Helarchaeota archaeon]|nr:hypothetical protein [Candidatus Helarchaeota archaeon]
MKEYKAELFDFSRKPEINVKSAQELLDRMAAQGWELKYFAGVLWVFEREKG